MDPVFLKAYKLLFSNEPDSADQLRCMLDNALKQRYGSHKSLATSLPAVIEGDKSLKVVIKNPRDSSEEESDGSGMSADNDKDEELTLDLLQEDLTCVVCKEIKVGVKNQLVECVECHSLYHQECHQPPITDADTNDPRLAWYCAACKKRMDKTLATIKSTNVASSASKVSVASNPTPKGSTKKSSSGSSVHGSSSSASSENSPSRSSTRSGRAASGKVVTPVFTIITADQRLQQMKKKAAAVKKGHDKGKLSK